MKKIVFLTMMFGLMVAFSGSVSAQKVFREFSGAVGSSIGGDFTTAANDKVRINVHTRSNTSGAAKAGTKYLLVAFFKANGAKNQVGFTLDLPQADQDYYKGNNAGVLNEGIVKNVGNPVAIRAGDKIKATFYQNEGKMIGVEVIRGGKSQGKMLVRW